MNPLRLRQIAGMLRIELRKTLLGKRGVPMLFLASLPVVLCAVQVLVMSLHPDEVQLTETQTAMEFAVVYQFILRGLVFLGCAWIFMNLFRGEMLDRSLHYYFLVPIRREVLLAGKFISGWMATSVLFVGSTLASILVLFSFFGPERAMNFLLRGPGLAQWLSYAGITALACLGYGAVFLLAGLYFRNPIIPAFIVFVWELINPALPSLLKKISVIFYLVSLLPMTPAEGEGPFALLTSPAPAWIAVPGLIAFTAVTLWIAGLRVRHMEIAYAIE